MTRIKSLRRQNRAFDLAEADAIAVALAPAAHEKRIAVFEERAPGTPVELERLGAVPADLQQAAALVLFGTGDGARPQEIADIHRTAAGGVVHELLHRGPVHVLEIGAADALRGVRPGRAQGDV